MLNSQNQQLTHTQDGIALLKCAMQEYGTDKNYQLSFIEDDDYSPCLNVMECEAQIAQYYFNHHKTKIIKWMHVIRDTGHKQIASWEFPVNA